jgi:hypothetical protein
MQLIRQCKRYDQKERKKKKNSEEYMKYSTILYQAICLDYCKGIVERYVASKFISSNQVNRSAIEEHTKSRKQDSTGQSVHLRTDVGRTFELPTYYKGNLEECKN